MALNVRMWDQMDKEKRGFEKESDQNAHQAWFCFLCFFIQFVLL